MAHCKVWLDNYSGQYYPGNQIQGKVILNFNSETTFRGIKVKIVCHEHTEWMGSESYHDPETNEYKTRDTMLEGDNDCFSTEILLHGGYSGTTSLPMGQHIYPFSITLPGLLPGTYSCEHGSVMYKLTAVVDRPMALDYEDQLIFVVVAPVDLNSIGRSDMNESSSYSDEKTVCCLCCAQGPISLDVELPKKSLIPGETVNVQARLTNMSNTNIEGVEFKLQQIISCSVETPSRDKKYITNTVVDLNEVGLGAHGEHTYTFPVTLPGNVPIPNFSLCKLFSVEYKSQVIAKLPGVHSNLSVDMVPIIGHIALGQSAGGVQTPPGPVPPQEGYQYPTGGNGYQPIPQPSFAPGQYPSPGYPPIPGQYPPQGGQYPGSAQYPPSSGAYPSLAGTAYPVAPPVGGVSVFPPSAPGAPPMGYNAGFNSKAQEANMPAQPSAPGNTAQGPAPPAYNSLYTEK